MNEVLIVKQEKKWISAYVLILCLTLLITCWGSHTVTVFSENSPICRKHTIVIDPGHGGVDGGASSCTGVLESKFNLEIGLRLRDLLHFLGYETKMIRTEDISVYREGDTIARKKMSDLKERVRMVGEEENPVLLSIHQNFFPDGQYSGAQVFYAQTEGSQALAENLQQDFVKNLNTGSKRQAKKSSGIYLMEHVSCPAVLIECGFLSNPEEEAKLRDKNYQQNLCCVMASTVAKFLSNT